jgi:hypothetical protein
LLRAVFDRIDALVLRARDLAISVRPGFDTSLAYEAVQSSLRGYKKHLAFVFEPEALVAELAMDDELEAFEPEPKILVAFEPAARTSRKDDRVVCKPEPAKKVRGRKSWAQKDLESRASWQRQVEPPLDPSPVLLAAYAVEAPAEYPRAAGDVCRQYQRT